MSQFETMNHNDWGRRLTDVFPIDPLDPLDALAL